MMDKYERRERNIELRNRENMQYSIGLTEEQHFVLQWLAMVRHDIHCGWNSMWNEQSGKYKELWELISYNEEKDLYPKINKELKSVELKEIKFPHFHSGDFRTIEDYDDDCWEDKMTEEEAYEELTEYLSNINDLIEDYLRKIDKKHQTKYCPTGIARMMM